MGLEAFDLKCRYCGAPLSQENLVAELAMARCVQCNAVSGVKGVKDWSRDPVELPEGFRLEEDGEALVIFYDGGRFQSSGLMLCAFGGSAALLFFGKIFRQMFGQFSWFDLFYIGLLPVLAMIFAVLDASGLLKRLRVRVSRDGVTVVSGPSRKVKSMYARDIVQVFTREFRGRETGVSYEVVACGRDGRLAFLVGGLPQASQSLYIEQRIERALGLKDVPVPGELPRSNHRASD